MQLTVVMRQLVHHLVATEQLELTPGATPDAVADHVLAALRDQARFAQAGPWLAEVLIACPLVVELFADDREITAALSEL